jgi:hypothetical protein
MARSLWSFSTAARRSPQLVWRWLRIPILDVSRRTKRITSAPLSIPVFTPRTVVVALTHAGM